MKPVYRPYGAKGLISAQASGIYALSVGLEGPGLGFGLER